MRRPPPSCFRLSQHVFSDEAVASLSRPPIIKIDDATFYRQHPSSVPDKSTNPPLFPNLTFTLASSSAGPQHWSIVGPSSSGKTTLLQILRGQHLCFPPTTRSYPYLASDDIARKDSRLRYSGTAIQYVGFGAGQGGLAESNTKGAYLSARYESRREQTDFSLLDYLKGHTELNAIEDQTGPARDDSLMCNVIRDLSLQNLVRLPVGNLSNGQTRRARIAKALLGEPEVLLLDEPFSIVTRFFQLVFDRLTSKSSGPGSTYAHSVVAPPTSIGQSKLATSRPISSTSRSNSRLDHTCHTTWSPYDG